MFSIFKLTIFVYLIYVPLSNIYYQYSFWAWLSSCRNRMPYFNLAGVHWLADLSFRYSIFSILLSGSNFLSGSTFSTGLIFFCVSRVFRAVRVRVARVRAQNYACARVRVAKCPSVCVRVTKTRNTLANG